MEIWFIIIISLCICSFLNAIVTHLRSSSTTNKLPPGPPSIPILTTLQWLRRSPLQIESLLRRYAAVYGPILTLRIFNRPSVFIADRTAAHAALLLHGALFADRPPPTPTGRIVTSNQHNISSAAYGPLWRLLRRNLTSQILHPSRVKSFNSARKWVLDVLLARLLPHSESGSPVLVVGHFQYAMFCLLVLMCFGDKLDESQIREIENVHRAFLLSFGRFNILNFWPKLTKIFLRKRWAQLIQLRRNQEKVVIPLIQAKRKARKNRAENRVETEQEESTISYIDTLLDLDLPDENRKLTDEEMVAICSEFLNAGTDTTSTALQWIMANLVKHPEIQNRVYAEIKGVMGNSGEEEEVKEEDLGKLPYLKAVVLEGLRRHPPGHFVLPHAVKEDTRLGDYVIPKNGTVNFMVAEMGWDPRVWEDPMAFKPERFMKEDEENGVDFDITGSKEIKMMPFGAGRRMCPGFGLAILHLEYFIANLVWRFEWKAVEGDEVDLSEKVEFTVVMEKPLKANIICR